MRFRFGLDDGKGLRLSSWCWWEVGCERKEVRMVVATEGG